MSRPSIRHRVMNLYRCGHFHPKSIQCRNVESSNGMNCVLVVCECLSSKTSVVHKVYAVFEDKPDGKYQIDLSSCSCKKGEYFCSHLIGFLYLVSTIQEKVQCQDDIEQFYPLSPLLIQGVLMLIENAVVRDRYRKQNEQRMRQKRRLEEYNIHFIDTIEFLNE